MTHHIAENELMIPNKDEVIFVPYNNDTVGRYVHDALHLYTNISPCTNWNHMTTPVRYPVLVFDMGSGVFIQKELEIRLV